MKYLASNLVKRALNLADLTNTDFISHEENINYLNETWREFYQLLINKGDKQFVEEAQLSGSGVGGYTEYKLPSDLYQVLSVKQQNGSVITRKSESESDTSATYDIVNDTLRLFGCSGNIILTYYTVPEFITIPDKTIYPDVSYSSINDMVSNISDSFMDSNGNVRNLLTSEFIGTSPNVGQLIGGKLLNYQNELYDLDGNDLNVQSNIEDINYYIIDSNNCKYIMSGEYTYQFINDVIEFDYLVNKGIKFSTGDILACDSTKFYFNNEELPFAPIETNTCQYIAKYNDHEFAILGGYVFEYYNGKLQNYEKLQYSGILQFVTKYGPVIYDGDVKVISALPDTEFNFPNELYIEVLAASLAVKYAMKQNAGVEGLNNLYDNYKSNFLNSLSQTNYSRIINVYR